MYSAPRSEVMWRECKHFDVIVVVVGVTSSDLCLHSFLLIFFSLVVPMIWWVFNCIDNNISNDKQYSIEIFGKTLINAEKVCMFMVWQHKNIATLFSYILRWPCYNFFILNNCQIEIQYFPCTHRVYKRENHKNRIFTWRNSHYTWNLTAVHTTNS